MTEPNKLFPEEVVRWWYGQRFRFCPHCQSLAFEFAAAYASHVSAADKARIVELEQQLATAQRYGRIEYEIECLLRKELEAAEASAPEFATLWALCFIYEAVGWWTCEIEMQVKEKK